jgi:hypothetical protein
MGWISTSAMVEELQAAKKDRPSTFDVWTRATTDLEDSSILQFGTRLCGPRWLGCGYAEEMCTRFE